MKKEYIEQNGLRRPGGLSLTKYALSLAAIPSHATVLDICCGKGGTVCHLRNEGYDAWGIDLEPQTVSKAHILCADARAIPFRAESFDGALMECCLSNLEPAEAALREAFRVLRPGAPLIITDLYAKNEAYRGAYRFDDRETILERLSNVGFTVALWEDHSSELTQFWMQAIMNGGKDVLCSLGLDGALLKRIRCGYYLLIARKGC